MFAIIPDIHGRKFWKEAYKAFDVKVDPIHTVIFLGDYVDPYESDDITDEECFENFQKIMLWKSVNPDNIKLLLGAHDLQYIGGHKCQRYSSRFAQRYHDFILKNFGQFDFCYCFNFNKERALCSHAGIKREWLLNSNINPTNPFKYNEIIKKHINDDPGDALASLMDVAMTNWGGMNCGSCIWASYDEFSADEYEIENTYQIFGHNNTKEPIITDTFMSIDCQKILYL